MSMFITILITTIALSFKRIFGLEFLESPPEFLIVPQDSQLSLTCKVDIAQVTIQWFYQQTQDGQEWFLYESGTLEYPNVQTSYEGFYFCKAVVEETEVLRSNLTRLKIAYLDDRFVRVPGQVYTVEGSTVEFECKPPRSYPPANVTWHKDSQPILTSRSYVTSNYTLVIVGTLPQDSGNYQCIATNSLTNGTRTSLEGELYVTQRNENEVEDDSEKPEPSIASYYTTVNEGDSASLLCAFQGVPYPAYRWYFSNGSQVPDVKGRFSYQYEKQVLQINSVRREMAGLYICEGTNIAGSSVINITLFVNYTEELGFEENFPEELTFYYENGGSASEVCKGKGSPPLTIRWYGEDGALLSDSDTLNINLEQLQNITAHCRVTNKDGEVRQTTRILVIDSPDEEVTDPIVATVQCYGDKMTLYVTESSDLTSYHLLDQGCVYPGETLQIDAPLEKCGTRAYYNETHIIYKNQVTGVSKHDSESGPISRGEGRLQIAFECAYKRIGSTDDIAWEARGQITVEVKGVGSFTFVLDLYDNANYSQKFDSSQYPVRLSLQDNIFLEVSLLSPDESLSLAVADIRASDSPSGSGGSFVYSLVQNGCIVDSTFKYLQTGDEKIKRFTLKAFHFMSSSPVVYVHAFVKICNTSNDSCSQLCTINGRANKRSAATDDTGSTEEYHIFQGPFVAFTENQMRIVSGSVRMDCWVTSTFFLLIRFFIT